MTVDQDPSSDHVEPLAEPLAPTWDPDVADAAAAAADPDVADELEDGEPAPEPLTDDEVAGILRVVVEAPFEWAGDWFGGRAPDPIAPTVRELWPLPIDQSSRIARRLTAAIPARWRGSRLLAHSPLALAGLELATAFQSRARQTERLIRAYNDNAGAAGDAPETTTDGTPPTRRRPAPRGSRRRADEPAQPVPGEPTSQPAPVAPDGWEGAGLVPGPAVSV